MTNKNRNAEQKQINENLFGFSVYKTIGAALTNGKTAPIPFCSFLRYSGNSKSPIHYFRQLKELLTKMRRFLEVRWLTAAPIWRLFAFGISYLSNCHIINEIKTFSPHNYSQIVLQSGWASCIPPLKRVGTGVTIVIVGEVQSYPSLKAVVFKG